MTSILRAFYDLKVSPCTFDIISFLVAAEMERKYRGIDTFELIIAANDGNHGFRDDADPAQRHLHIWALDHLLLASARLFQNCRRALHCPSREDARTLVTGADSVFPPGYTLDTPVASYLHGDVLLQTLRGRPEAAPAASFRAHSLVGQWLAANSGGRRPVTITLREMSRQPNRNSNLAEWGKFARSLDSETFFPVILRDTEHAFAPSPPEIDGLARYDAAAIDLELRMALYEMAYLNLMINNGPMGLLNFSPSVRYIVFKNQSGDVNTSERYLGRVGVTREWLPYPTTDHQRVLFEDDTAEFIREQFDAIVALIESGKPPKRGETASARIWMERFARYGGFDRVEQIYRIVRESEPTTKELDAGFIDLVQNGTKSALERNDIGDARRGLEVLVKYFPESPDLHLQLAQCLLQGPERTKAVEIFEKLETMGVDVSALRPIHADLLLESERYAEAAIQLQHHLDVNPRDHIAMFNLATALRGCGDTEKQITTLRAMLKLIPADETEAIARAETQLREAEGTT